VANILVRPVEPGDAEELAPRLRQADLEEIAAASGRAPVEVLRVSAAMSTHSWAVEIDGELACLMGVTPVSIVSGIGCPWLLGSDAVPRHAGAFIKQTLVYIPLMLEAYPHLFNFVDARNTKAIRWLKRAGFNVMEPMPYGKSKMPFHPFEMKA
jgi:hypothetical protein